MKRNIDKILKIFLDKVRKKTNKRLKKIILFGSRARGDFDITSDYDIILIFDNVSQKTEESINEIEGEMLYEYNAVISAFPFSEKDIKTMKYEPFILNATKEGKII